MGNITFHQKHVYARVPSKFLPHLDFYESQLLHGKYVQTLFINEVSLQILWGTTQPFLSFPIHKHISQTFFLLILRWRVLLSVAARCYSSQLIKRAKQCKHRIQRPEPDKEFLGEIRNAVGSCFRINYTCCLSEGPEYVTHVNVRIFYVFLIVLGGNSVQFSGSETWTFQCVTTQGLFFCFCFVSFFFFLGLFKRNWL